MSFSPEQLQGFHLLSVVAGFVGYVALGPLPPPGGGISRMGYFVRTGAIALGSTLAVVLAAAFISTFAVWASSPVYPLTILVIGLAVGAYAGLVALGRSADSGGRRGFAALGIIPFANLWVAFAPPTPDPARPPYFPANPFLRFLVGFVCLAVGTGIASGLGTWIQSPAGTSAMLNREIASINAGLPRKLDEITTLVAVRHDAYQRQVLYEHLLDIPDGFSLSSEDLKNSIAPGLCEDPAIVALLESGYSMVYGYETTLGAHIDGFAVDRADCR